MSQVTDRTVGANPTGFDMRTELNNIIGALETCNSGTSEPLNTVQFMYWFDTLNETYYYLKQRNHDNTAWNTILRYTLSTKIVELVSNGVVVNGFVNLTDDQTKDGILTFLDFPVTPSSAPVTDYQVSNRKFVTDLPLSGLINGIKVGNTALADAATLDWYEEGTFTPTIVGATTAGVGTYSTQFGKYTRVGNRVDVSLLLAWSAHTGTGFMKITGFPFNFANAHGFMCSGYNLTITGQLYIEFGTGSSTGLLYALNNGVASSLAMDTSATVICNFTYFV